jgi:LacI family transcriptional regulator
LDGYDDVAEETRQLIVKTAHEMGYVPNQAARQLRRRRSDTIGYILPAEKPRFSDPYFAEFIAGLGDEAAAHGFELLVSTAPPGSQVERQAYE